MSKRLTTEEFIIKSKSVHGDLYSYEQSVYISNKSPITIICNRCHNTFSQIAGNHLQGMGCKLCNNYERNINRRLIPQHIIDRCNDIHKSKYTYDFDGVYKGNNQKFIVTCPTHGQFKQRICSHLSGHGCMKCLYERKRGMFIKPVEDFIKQCNDIHNNKYDYSKVIYKGSKAYVDILCPNHGLFSQTPDVHLNHKCGCPNCGKNPSNPELVIFNHIKSLCEDAERHNRKLIKPKELDIIIPSKQIAIEFCGLYWHSTALDVRKSPSYHKNKMEMCNKIGWRLITVFEDEWYNNSNIVLKKLTHILSNTGTQSLNGRDCEIIHISHKEQQSFLKDNHIQGPGSCSIRLGLKYNNELVSVMTFKRRKEGVYELIRYASIYNVRGGFSKLLKRFTLLTKCSKIITFLDLRWGDINNNVYKKTGFELDSILPPDYRYVVGKKRVHKFNFRHKKLQKILPNYKSELSETQNTTLHNLHRIYDCGLARYVYNTKSNKNEEQS